MAASRPFREWKFTATAYVALGALIACLFSLTSGQAFPTWMMVGLLVLGAAGLVSTFAHNTGRTRFVSYSQAPAAAAVLFLGVGVALSARPAEPVTQTVTIADVSSGSTRVGGASYYLDSTDGNSYEVRPSDFQPQLPQLDGPEFRGVQATLVLDRGTRGVLAFRINGVDYYTAEYQNPTIKLLRGLGIGMLLVATAGVMAWMFGYAGWLRRSLGRGLKT